MAKPATKKLKREEVIPQHVDEFLKLLARWTVEAMNTKDCTGK